MNHLHPLGERKGTEMEKMTVEASGGCDQSMLYTWMRNDHGNHGPE